MTVRMSSGEILAQGIRAIMDQQSRLAETELKLATGKRIGKPSDDPSDAVRIHDLTREINGVQQRQANIGAARGQLEYAETVVKQAGESLQRVRELMVQANNATLNSDGRQAIAGELAALNEHLLSIANTRDASGRYLFGGYQSSSVPFSRVAGEVVYHGDQGTRSLAIGPGLQIETADSGYAVFQDIRVGNGVFDVVAGAANSGTGVVSAESAGPFEFGQYTLTVSQPDPAIPPQYVVSEGSGVTVQAGVFTPGEPVTFAGVALVIKGQPVDGDSFEIGPAPRQDVFSTIQQAVELLSDSGSSTARNNGLNRALDGVDQAIGHFLDVRASIGARMNTLDAEESINSATLLGFEKSLSTIADIDVVEAINELNVRRTALEAAQLAYVQIRDLSLFKYL